MRDDHQPTRRSLRRAVLLAFAPLCVAVIVAAVAQVVFTRAIARDVQRLFEELREVALARMLVDELQGVQQWVEASPTARAGSHALILADVAHHHAAAKDTLSRFSIADDPSRVTHDADEAALVARIAGQLESITGLLASGARLDDLATPLATAMHDASGLLRTIENETHEIGSQLDERSQGIGQLLLLLSLGSVAIVGGLGWLLVRRVLVPVRALQLAAGRLGRGELEAALPVHRHDELGDLALAFHTMATRLRESHQELERRVEQRSREVLRSAQLAQLGTLAAGIAHEINNPLASIVACADGLLRDLDREGGPAGPELREYLQILRKEAMRARDITVRLLRLARQEQPRREQVWLGDEAQEVAALFAHQLQVAGVTLRIAGQGRGPAIHGDAAEWRQVLFNLLRNALDASPRGGQITVELSDADGTARLVVADEGPGIPEADLDRIFEPFFTTKDPGHGTGLGLAIVHRIVAAHGGRITAGNGTRGARFSIEIAAAS